MPDTLKIAGVQFGPHIQENQYNLARIQRSAVEAAGNGAGLVVFPECALSGYVYSSRQEALPFMETVPGDSTEKMAGVCRHLGIHVIYGLLEKDGRKCYNAAVLVGPAGLIGRYRKSHLPFLGIDRYLDKGNEPFRVFQTSIGNIGILICYDASFPESARSLALQGADIIVLPTNWPPNRDKVADFVINTRAFENRVHLVAVDRVGVERGAQFLGRSKIVSATGDTLVEASRTNEEIIYGEVSLAAARNKRIIYVPGEFETDLFADRRPELYGEITRKKP